MGNLIYTIIYKINGWESYYGAIAFACSFTVLLGLVSFLKRSSFFYLKVTLSLTGAVLFVRALALFFGGYPIDPVQWA